MARWVAKSLLLLGALPAADGATDLPFSGQFTLRGGHDWIASDSILEPLAGDSAWDASAELRLMPGLRAGRKNSFSVHYEFVGKISESSLGDLGLGLPLAAGSAPDDRHRLMDLSRTVHNDDGRSAYHRLDRLSWRHSAEWGTLTIGREAVTWGNGLVFNPMDLFNPFAPTDVERDYKLGDDLIHVNLYPAGWTGNLDWQILLVPRRNPGSGDVEARESSLAVKTHFFAGDSEWDLLAAWHYDEAVLGAGHIGYIGSAVSRFDVTMTFAESGHTFFSAVANIDRSWTWSGINWYGSLEIHYNTVGTSEYAGLTDEAPLLERLVRSEMHTVGRAYAAPALQIELHPLWNLYLAAIANLEDPSAMLLPRLVWSPAQNMEITLGGSFAAGATGTEFGGIPVPATGRFLNPPDRLYLWAKAYF